MATLPTLAPVTATIVQVIGGENLMRLAEVYLGDATQWYRIADVNYFPGEPPDFILSAADAQRLNGTLQIPPVDPTATWP